MGVIPPLNYEQWEEAFSLYKQTPQYKKINEGMSLTSFKRIYFWEFLHRLWARSMGLIFVLPLMFFIRKKWIDRNLFRELAVILLLAMMVASFGWIMVASGLVSRPWVSAYKLTIHLCLALLLYSYLLWTYLKYTWPGKAYVRPKRLLLIFLGLLGVQIALGGLMSGIKAALVFPTFPDYSGSFIPQVLMTADSWNVSNFLNYEGSPFLAALIQFFHRTLGYVLLLLGLVVFKRHKELWKNSGLQLSRRLFAFLLVMQVFLGISVLIKSVGEIPISLGVMHQAVAILLVTCTLWLVYFEGRTLKDVQ